MIEATRMEEQFTMTTDVTEPRQTPLPAGRRFAEALAEGVAVLARGAGEVFATALPGGAIVAAATRELGPQGGGEAGGGGARPEGPGGVEETAGGGGTGVEDYWKLQQQSQDFNLQFLQLQENLSMENRRFSALSNVLKARHDTAKSVIQNIR